MPLLQTRCSAAVKTRFRALAASKGLTESILLRRMVATILSEVVPDAPVLRSETRGGRGGQRGQIKLRLWANEIKAIRALAEPEGYSAQAWIVRQLRHRLESAVPFAKDELNELRDALRQIGAIGRNLNALVHMLHRRDRLAGDLVDVPTLAKKVETLRRAVVAMMTRATHRGEGGGVDH